MSRAPRALIIGGSVGGLFAAHLLRRLGGDVVVYERATTDLASRGAAIGFTEELAAVMARIGTHVDLKSGINVRSFIALDRIGAVAHEVGRIQVYGAWSQISRALKAILPASCYRRGMVFDCVEQDGRCVSAVFADGSRAEGDLLIGADGVQSTVRRQFLRDVPPRYAGYLAWRGVVDETEIATADHDLIFRHVRFCLARNGMLLCIPIPGDDGTGASAHKRRCCYVWYCSADERALRRLCADAHGRQHGASIPPLSIRPEVVGQLRAAVNCLFAPVAADIFARVQ